MFKAALPFFFVSALVSDLQKLPSFKDVGEDSIEPFANNIMIVSLKTEDETAYLRALQELRTLENVGFVGVAVTDNYNMNVTNGEIMALFKDDVSEQDRRDIIERQNLTIVREGSGDWDVLKIKIRNDEDHHLKVPVSVFDQSNALSESGLVHFAEPYFHVLISFR